LKSPWIGTKNIWDLFIELDLLDKEIYSNIKSKKGIEWTEEFAEKVYEDVRKHKYFLTNLGKCTQINARELPDSVYKEYLQLLKQEFNIINPKVIILFGNQVSSIVLDERISVSQVRKRCFIKDINCTKYKFYSVYYPVGNGRFNIMGNVRQEQIPLALIGKLVFLFFLQKFIDFNSHYFIIP